MLYLKKVASSYEQFGPLSKYLSKVHKILFTKFNNKKTFPMYFAKI